jgi:cell division transport system ATP-binding protein
MAIIELSDVNLEYPNNMKALDNINLFINSGEFVFLMGPTGSGKSSILKLLYREEIPTSGEVYINNHDVTELRREKIFILRRKIGVVFQDFKLLDYKTVGENVAYALEVTDFPSDKISERVDMVLKVVGMLPKKNSYPDELSGGEMQLTSIARALANSPPVLLADEPTGNLDPDSSWNILKILNYINSRGTTVVVATHDVEMVRKMNCRIVYLKKGKIVSDQGCGNTLLDSVEIPDAIQLAAENGKEG